MTSIEKMKKLIAIQKNHHKANIQLRDGDWYAVNLHNPANEDDRAYDVYADGGSLVTLFMDDIKDIEEIFDR